MKNQQKSEWPLVTVGIPTYNRPDGLRMTLDCIINQTYTNLDIIVADNGSTNPNVDILMDKFLSQDKRIRYVKHKENKGPTFNFAFVLKEATGDYFMWAADDDLWEPDFIELCMEGFFQYKNAVMSMTGSDIIDGSGNLIEVYKNDLNIIDSSIYTRLQKFMQYTCTENVGIYGIYKRKVLDKFTCEQFMGSDQVLLAQMLTCGSFIQSPKIAFHYRKVKVTHAAEYAAMSGKKSRFHYKFLFIIFLKNYIMSIFKVKHLSILEKIRASITIFKGFISVPFVRGELKKELMLRK